MHESYFSDYRARLPVADAIAALVADEQLSSLTVVEFGCSGGNNLRLLRERVTVPVQYVGIDIQQNAIDFARRSFPQDTFFVCPTEGLNELRPKLPRADVFLVSGVLYYLPQKEAQTVLNFAATIADHLVVCDILDRFDQANGSNDGLFLHPYGVMCERAGFAVSGAPTPPQAGDRHSVFAARTALPASLEN